LNILVTGGAGFIGSTLCEKLITLNHKIICIDNFNNFYNPLIKKNNIANLIECKDFILYEADICNRDSLKKIFKENKVDLVIHLAAMAGVRPSIENPLLYERVNIEGTINILDCLRENNIKKMIFASSSSVYGGNKKIPFSEEDKVDNPISPYAATKKAGELICYTYHHLYDISIYCLRFFTVYGPRQRPEMAIHKFTKQIFDKDEISMFGDGRTSRDYTYIDDIITGITNCIQSLKGYEIINLGNSHPTSLANLIKLLESTSGKQAVVRKESMKPGDVFTTFADISKASKLLNYAPETPINEGINKFISWYKQMKENGKLYE